jgi:DNA-binding Lrp family transcriptional regulator
VADEFSSHTPAPGGASTEITLGLLNAVQENARLTQRSAAHQLGIALGLANAYLKRCIKKGLIKVQQVPPKRYAYYLTPQGFAEKSRLTAEYLSSSLSFFRRAREQLGEVLQLCSRRGWRRIALAGVGDLAEIAQLCARDHAVAVVGIIDRSRNVTTFSHLPVVASVGELAEAVDAVVVTDVLQAQTTYEALAAVMPKERLLAPRMLGVISRLDEPEGSTP